MNDNEKLFQCAITEYELNNIPIRKFKNKKRIGRGAFGYVFKCNIDGDSRMVAIKEISVSNENDSTSIKNFLNELKLHSKAKNRRIIELFGMSYDSNEDLCYLVMELAECHLREYLSNKKDGLPWNKKIELAIQLTEGLSYIHNTMNVAHRDLHTKNVLIWQGNVKIADFGLSKNLNSATSSKNNVFGVIPFIDPQKLEDSCYKLNTKSDIYGLGVILWEISSCFPPFYQQDDGISIIKNIIQNVREAPIIGTPLSFIQLYSKCWDALPSLRPTTDQILNKLNSLSLEPIYHGTNYNNNMVSNTSDYFTDNFEESLDDSISSGLSEYHFLYPTNSAPSFIADYSSKPVKKEELRIAVDHYCEKDCNMRIRKFFQEQHSHWTCGNLEIDKMIREFQEGVWSTDLILEWIPFEQFYDIKKVNESMFSITYSAYWRDGPLLMKDLPENERIFKIFYRKGIIKVALKKFKYQNTSTDYIKDFIKE
ncbi:9562_t:CDS:2, partial [Acaulospora morrowiae]